MTNRRLQNKYIVLPLLLSLFSSSSFAALVYSEDFTGQLDKGVNGAGLNDFTGVNWTVDITNASLDDRNDYVKVVNPSNANEFLEARDVGGQPLYAQWLSPVINLTGGSGFSFLIDVFRSNGVMEAGDYVEISYLLDGTPTVVDTLFGNFAAQTVSANVADGFSTLQIVAEFSNGTQNGEGYGIDNIEFNAVQRPDVPEPTTLALLGFGLAGMGYKRKKTK